MNRYPTTQNHHYIPRFLLRRFAMPPVVQAPRKKGNRKAKGSEMVKVVDLEESLPKISIEPVRTTFAQRDMYKDDSKFDPWDQMRMERKLEDIEREAGQIIAKVVVAYQAGKDFITLSRFDKDLLRKFLFVMKYRCTGFFLRFNHQTAETYDSNDRDSFLEYMRSKNFKRPLDIWFDNLTQIINMPMDPAGNWTTKLRECIYPDDAEWLFSNIRSMYMAFVTPETPEEEFVLTENAFEIHEGPVSNTINRFTGEETLTAYTEFHLINIISPRIAMVLRQNLLPEPLEDLDEEIHANKTAMLAAYAQLHCDPAHATSFLQNLPIAKARNSYTTIKEGRLVLAEGADGMPRAGDTFRFPFFRLTSHDTQTINLVMLDQAHRISKLVFRSESALRKALEFYLSYPTRTRGLHSLKTITDRPNDPRLLLYQKLEHLAHSLGSEVKAIYHVDPLLPDDDSSSLSTIVAEVMLTAKPTLQGGTIDMAMTVMAECLKILQLSIEAVHALDLIKARDGYLPLPAMVFHEIQLMNLTQCNRHTACLIDFPLHMWMHIWKVLVEKALQQTEVDDPIGEDIEHMQTMLRQASVRSTEDLPTDTGPSSLGFTSLEERLACNVQKHTLPIHQTNANASPTTSAAPELSMEGLRKAFEDIGHHLLKQENSPTETNVEIPRLGVENNNNPTTNRKPALREERVRISQAAVENRDKTLHPVQNSQLHEGENYFSSLPGHEFLGWFLLVVVLVWTYFKD